MKARGMIEGQVDGGKLDMDDGVQQAGAPLLGFCAALWDQSVRDEFGPLRAAADERDGCAILLAGVIGGKMRKLDELDLRTLGVVLEVNGEIKSMAAGAAVLGNPLAAVAMLANHLGARGQEIPAGTFIMTGGVTEAITVNPGDNVNVRFQDLGTVSMRFV